MNEDDKAIIEYLINEELDSYLDSGYKLTDEWVVKLRDLLKRYNLKELYDFDKKFKENK